MNTQPQPITVCPDMEAIGRVSAEFLSERVSKLETALADLLDQIDSLEGIEFTRDIDRYKAEANWDSVLDGARAALTKAAP